MRAALRRRHAPPARSFGLLDEGVLEQLLADGEITDVGGLEYAHCPAEQTVTAHVVHTDGSQSCIDCGHTLNGS
ncbi:hypothetical protein [Streptomyces fructofermentans]|uniref:Uncharacterized protein n=1 Tax=Streptomyces fructofermentans TaxID=152141 RepID=A0A918NVH7_9ACTN|nr:hypothetical protein [Streptomyces fructofermentans]GGX99037.1 hypothetical protein GCM10010515_76490 [Streptomyces fructofermentans]